MELDYSITITSSKKIKATYLPITAMAAGTDSTAVRKNSRVSLFPSRTTLHTTADRASQHLGFTWGVTAQALVLRLRTPTSLAHNLKPTPSPMSPNVGHFVV